MWGRDINVRKQSWVYGITELWIWDNRVMDVG